MPLHNSYFSYPLYLPTYIFSLSYSLSRSQSLSSREKSNNEIFFCRIFLPYIILIFSSQFYFTFTSSRKIVRIEKSHGISLAPGLKMIQLKENWKIACGAFLTFFSNPYSNIDEFEEIHLHNITQNFSRYLHISFNSIQMN